MLLFGKLTDTDCHPATEADAPPGEMSVCWWWVLYSLHRRCLRTVCTMIKQHRKAALAHMVARRQHATTVSYRTQRNAEEAVEPHGPDQADLAFPARVGSP